MNKNKLMEDKIKQILLIVNMQISGVEIKIWSL